MASANDQQLLQRDDSSARRYAKTSHLAHEQRQDELERQLNGMTPAERQEALKAAANEELESTSDFRRARALTADNLERIPNADQLAPGIRLPGQGVGDRPSAGNVPETDADLPTSSTDATNSLETRDTSVGNFGESGAPIPGVPPELDPRASSFRPHSPGAASVFSVAVQPPGSPKPYLPDASEPASPFVDTRPTVPQGAGSSYSTSARGSSPPLSAGFSPGDTAAVAGRLAPGPSGLSRTVASVAPSEAGSVSSSGTGGGQGSTGTADDQELALRAAYIERQRMREREQMGGEAGVGGTSLPVFPPRGSTPLAFNPSLSTRLDAVSRAGSTAATVGTSSPPHSLSGSEIPDGVASPSRRGSVDSTETLASVRAPPSIVGFDLGGGGGGGGGGGSAGGGSGVGYGSSFGVGGFGSGGIESRRMSRGGSSIGVGEPGEGRRGSDGAVAYPAMDEDGDAPHAERGEPLAPAAYAVGAGAGAFQPSGTGMELKRPMEDEPMEMQQESDAETLAKLAH